MLSTKFSHVFVIYKVDAGYGIEVDVNKAADVDFGKLGYVLQFLEPPAETKKKGRLGMQAFIIAIVAISVYSLYKTS